MILSWTCISFAPTVLHFLSLEGSSTLLRELCCLASGHFLTGAEYREVFAHLSMLAFHYPILVADQWAAQPNAANTNWSQLLCWRESIVASTFFLQLISPRFSLCLLQHLTYCAQAVLLVQILVTSCLGIRYGHHHQGHRELHYVNLCLVSLALVCLSPLVVQAALGSPQALGFVHLFSTYLSYSTGLWAALRAACSDFGF